MSERKEGLLKQRIRETFKLNPDADAKLLALGVLFMQDLDECKQDFYSKFQIERNAQGKFVVKTSTKYPSQTLANFIIQWFGEAEK